LWLAQKWFERAQFTFSDNRSFDRFLDEFNDQQMRKM
jgi:hypothetical protein